MIIHFQLKDKVYVTIDINITKAKFLEVFFSEEDGKLFRVEDYVFVVENILYIKFGK